MEPCWGGMTIGEDNSIDTTRQRIDEPNDVLCFACSKLALGWPSGTDRAELSIEGRVLERVPFEVAP